MGEGRRGYIRWSVEEVVVVGGDVPISERGHPERFYLDWVVGC
jgi:hypothetical protein